MKIKRKVIFFIALMSLFYCITLMQETYAKYVSSANANTNLTIAKWNILLNNQDIIENSNFSDSISPVFSGTSNIRSNVIAPTAEGYFDITLDGTNTDVSFQYTINLSLSETNTVSDLVLYKYVLDGNEYTFDGSDIVGNINLNDANKTKSIRFFVKWNDDAETESMNNSQDSTAANSGVAAFDVNVNVIQLQ